MMRIKTVLLLLSIFQVVKISHGSSHYLPVYPVIEGEINATSQFLTYLPSVSIFYSTCQEAVLSNEILLELFDFSHVTPDEYARGMHQHIMNAMKAAQVPDALEQTGICTNNIAKYHKTLNLPLVLRVNVYTTAKFLLLKGILNEQNAVPLALTFTSFLEKHAKQCVTAGNTEWRFKVLMDGFYDFVAKLNLVCKESAYIIAALISNEWRLASLYFI
ncbi:hypothetical protein TNIN_409631 [Trichonephila inaurata madagascariensis]|uniref:Uncharacterized protein n=1 Tax=Trichonephila inaurata madagascariensis TaxID=2747483 RepID=A0A8X6XR31_9ARAC|nr:hypothetical protein TNIN_409631 [Trichonephila inaurata madagascariensis]